MRRWVVAAAAGIVVAGAVAAAVWWPSGDDSGLPPARARVYADFSACLLTGGQGLASPGAGAVWAGLQDASGDTRIKVSYLAASGPATEANYLPYLNSLAQRRCDVILTAGEPGTSAALAQAAAHPAIRFVAVGGTGREGPNVSAVRVTDHVRGDVAETVRAAARAAGR
ncbi:hypothetical protein [Amycolatopsis sp. NPDC004079]|uniref:hypothetical protein n=1 Tax=Amycolatopsis sp. NPDC004079 TaxID=3154549 RepID=UPI0033A0AF56